MYKVRFISLFLAFSVVTILTSQYQSCVSNSHDRYERELASHAASQDELINLHQSAIVLSDLTTDFLLEGTCSKKVDNPAEIEWVLYDPSYRVLERGKGECHDGVLSARVNGIGKVDCKKKHSLKAVFKNAGALFETQMDVSKDCPPIRRSLANISGLAEGMQCYLELRNFTAGDQCVESCYQERILKSQRIIERNQCPSGAESDNPTL